MKRGLQMRLVLSALMMLYVLLFSGCEPTATPLSPTPYPQRNATPAPNAPGLTPTEGLAPRLIRLWLPPQFDPASGTPAGDLLRIRLDEFATAHPGLTIEVRLKAESGPAGLLESLTITSSAASAALPDLISLPRQDIESAALKGLIHPLGGLTSLFENPDWYYYAHQMAYLQNSAFGFHFAGDQARQGEGDQQDSKQDRDGCKKAPDNVLNHHDLAAPLRIRDGGESAIPYVLQWIRLGYSAGLFIKPHR